MAVAHYSGDLRHIGNGTSYSFAFDVGTGTDRALHHTARNSNNTSYATATYAGASLTSHFQWGNSYSGLSKVAPASGSNTLAVSWGSYTNGDAYTVAANDVDQTTPFGTVQIASQTSTSPTTPSITCPAGGLVYGLSLHSYAQNSYTSTSGTVIGLSAYWGTGNSYRSDTGTLAWYAPASVWWHAMGFEINPAAAAAGHPTRPITILDAVHRASNW